MQISDAQCGHDSRLGSRLNGRAGRERSGRSKSRRHEGKTRSARRSLARPMAVTPIADAPPRPRDMEITLAVDPALDSARMTASTCFAHVGACLRIALAISCVLPIVAGVLGSAQPAGFLQRTVKLRLLPYRFFMQQQPHAGRGLPAESSPTAPVVTSA
jgi:hypothetical protein